jgi:N-carbamoyl-L-amino-acid hydrolase
VEPSPLHDLIAAFARFGATEDGGVRRLTGSPQDKAARDRLSQEIMKRGLKPTIDPIGNMFGLARLAPASRDAVLVGSHLDSQPTGGRFDGAYGVIAGLLAAETLMVRAAAQPGAARRNLALVNWTNEEGARFQPSLTGSSVFAGGLALEDAHALADPSGATLGEALTAIGYLGAVPFELEPTRYVELHIEQGVRLEEAKADIGIVTGAWSARKLSVVFLGEASHTGPMPMRLRRDALRAAAGAINALYEEIENSSSGAHASAAKIDVRPNSPNVVPARVQVWFEIRHRDEEMTQLLGDRLLHRIENVCAPIGVAFEVAVDERRRPVSLDSAGVDVIRDASARLGFRTITLETVAGHDALAVQKRVPASLMFVPSRGGLSHNPGEFTDEASLDKGLAALTETLWRMVTAR